jgi:hypothetical protein
MITLSSINVKFRLRKIILTNVKLENFYNKIKDKIKINLIYTSKIDWNDKKKILISRKIYK